jgi:hypothetical protein
LAHNQGASSGDGLLAVRPHKAGSGVDESVFFSGLSFLVKISVFSHGSATLMILSRLTHPQEALSLNITVGLNFHLLKNFIMGIKFQLVNP